MTDTATPNDDFDADFLAALTDIDPQAPSEDTPAAEPVSIDPADAEADDTDPAEADGEDEGTGDDTDGEVSDAEVHLVKVDGEELEVTLDEALKGYMRQAKFTKLTTAIKERENELSSFVEEVRPQLERISQLDEAWNTEPTEVLTAFVLATENPSQAIIEQVKRVVAAGKADRTLRNIFGITDEVEEQLREELTGQAKAREGDAAARELAALKTQQAQQAEVAAKVAQFETQLSEILAENALALDAKELTEFRHKLSKYAIDNDLRSLKQAYRLMSAEDAAAAQAAAPKVKAKAKATAVTGRSSAGAGSTTPLQQSANTFDDAFGKAWDALGM